MSQPLIGSLSIPQKYSFNYSKIHILAKYLLLFKTPLNVFCYKLQVTFELALKKKKKQSLHKVWNKKILLTPGIGKHDQHKGSN